MIRIIPISDVGEFADKTRPASGQTADVSDIIRDVRKDGDSALARYEEMFGGRYSARISQERVAEAHDQITQGQRNAIVEMRDRLVGVETLLRESLQDMTARIGSTTVSRRFVPLKSVGCYVPGGLAKYPSSAVMSVSTAKVAGVPRVVVITPSAADGVDPVTLAAADICGADEIYGVGGAHGVAALAYGTKTIQRVDKIVGPGGRFVTAAKLAVSNAVSIDMLAGPTELAVIADESADPTYVAADIIAQAEHSEDTFCCAITTSGKVADRIQEAIADMVPKTRRHKIVDASLSENGFIAVCRNWEDAARLAETLAPEHLQIMTKSPEEMASRVQSAGLVLTGHNSPSPASDYLLGTNHILPTGTGGRTRGALSVLDFVKLVTTVSTDIESLTKIAGHMKEITASEGLPGHYESVRCRI